MVCTNDLLSATIFVHIDHIVSLKDAALSSIGLETGGKSVDIANKLLHSIGCKLLIRAPLFLRLCNCFFSGQDHAIPL